MRTDDSTRRPLRPDAPEVFARPLGGRRWQPIGFRSYADLQHDVAGSDFLVVSFGRRGMWLITPAGHPFEIAVRPRGNAATP